MVKNMALKVRMHVVLSHNVARKKAMRKQGM